MTTVLNGVTVLDLSTGISGPMLGMALADQGAEVIRIESPDDPTRDPLSDRVWNRGKQRAFLDPADAAQHEELLALAAHADVFIESYTPGITARLGIDYESLKTLNPGLIYVSITAYGRDTPDQDRPAEDTLVAARTGLFNEIRGWREGALNHMLGRPGEMQDVEVPREHQMGPPRDGPLMSGSRWPSLGAFYAAFLGTSAALRAREITGKGQWVETSLLQGALVCMTGVYQRAENPDVEGFDSWVMLAHAPKGHFLCKDGRWIQNWVPNPRFVMAVSEGDAIDATPDLKAHDDPDRFGTEPGELVVMAYYQPLFAERFAKFTSAEWVKAAVKADMTLKDVRTIEEGLTDPLFLADGCVAEVQDPELGPLRETGIPYKMSRTPGLVKMIGSGPGGDTAAIRAKASALVGRSRQRAPAGKTLDAPLAGIKVVDLGMAVAGPYGTQLLADLGAEVIKINSLFEHYWHRTHIAYCCNRNKRSIALNLKDPRAKEVLEKIVAEADILHSNMRYDALERMGMDYASLKDRHPGLIYCHTRGFEDGPRKLHPGNDQLGACLTGVQHEDGGVSDGGKPIWASTSLGDTGNGLLSAIACVQALYHRDRTGEGQMVDTSIVNAFLMNDSFTYAFPDGTGPERQQLDAMLYGYTAGHRLYQTADSWLMLAVKTGADWDRLLRILADKGGACSSSSGDPDRLQARGLLADAIAATFRNASASEWFGLLDRAGVPVEIVDATFGPRLHDNPLYKERQWTVSFPHESVGRIDQIGMLCNLSDMPGRMTRSPLIVGECTREIMEELGYESATIDAYVAEGTVSETYLPASMMPAMAGN